MAEKFSVTEDNELVEGDKFIFHSKKGYSYEVGIEGGKLYVSVGDEEGTIIFDKTFDENTLKFRKQEEQDVMAEQKKGI